MAQRSPAPGGGVVAALTLSAAACLVAMAARYSPDHLADADAIVGRAETVRVRAAALADEDGAAYGKVIEAYAALRSSVDVGRQDLHTALTAASKVPLEVAVLGAETAALAARLVAEGKHDLRGDAATALLLAEAATRSAAHLVTLNVAAGGDKPLARRAAESVSAAREAGSRVG